MTDLVQFGARWIDSVRGRLQRTEDREGNDPGKADEFRSSLFRCPDCEAVYVAVDKATCSTCDTTVDQIPSTLVDTA